MADEKPFIPEFGPNGAVMNSPTMTDAMRERIAEAEVEEPFPRSTVLQRDPILVCVFALVVLQAPATLPDVGSVNAVGVAVLIVPAFAVIGFLAWVQIRMTLTRWELIGKVRDPARRRLTLPSGMRWIMAFSDLYLFAMLAACLLITPFRIMFLSPDQYAVLFLLFIGLAGLGLALANVLRGFASSRGWISRPAPRS